MKPARLSTSVLLLVASLAWATIAGSYQAELVPTPEQTAFFESRVRPVLAENCFSCHGPDVQLASLRLDSRDALVKGGVSGPVIAASDPDKSLLVKAIRHTGALKMPKGGKLNPAQIQDIETWVKMGAPWPKTTPARASAPTLWSLRPVSDPLVPKVQGKVFNSVDAYVLAKLEPKRETLSPLANRQTLIRRLSFDLIGLPPTWAEVQAFLSDKSPNAYEKVVDRLLASPHYGERQARLWMDVARYADTKGYVFEEDRNYPHAYTYRDWLIRSFNADLPYDQFILKQIAADRLPAVQNGEDKTDLAALGFLTIGRRFLNNVPDIIDDRIDVTMRGMQGLTVSCARCHDHKFDPIPTQDYYSLYGVFASSGEVQPPISPRAVRDPWQVYSREVADILKQAKAITQAQVKRLREIKADPNRQSTLSPEIHAVLQMLREGQEPNRDQLGKIRGSFEAGQNDQLKRLEETFAAKLKAAPQTPEFAMGLQDSANPKDGYVFNRGNPGNRGEIAPRRYLAALAAGKERKLWKVGSGRLELAQALASRTNPLTARVIANRLWQQHFGQGLVRTPSDFGNQGERPTHPELLDHLATYLMRNGWSLKRLHRLIVNSHTYRQSSQVSDGAFRADPDNRRLTRTNRRRLDLEQMRDAILAASGRIDLSHVGGKSVDLWSKPFTNRRAVYGFIERQNLPGVFRTFDFASPDSTSPRRFMTTIPQQALFFMNSEFALEQALAVSNRPDVKSAANDAEVVRAVYRCVLVRDPMPDESRTAVEFLGHESKGNVSRRAMLAQGLMMTNEFLFVD